MNAGQWEEQRRNFAITKSRLQHMKPDPLVSIDDFISKMIFSPTEKAVNPSNPKLHQTTNFVEGQPVDEGLCFPNTNLTSHTAPDGSWNEFKSLENADNSSQTSITHNAEGVENIDDFDTFASYEPSFHPRRPQLLTDFIFKSSGQNGCDSPSLSFCTSSETTRNGAPKIFDEFSDFIGSRLPGTSSISNEFSHPSNVAKADELRTTQFSPVESDETPQREPAFESNNTEDAFEDFQACAYEASPAIEQPPKNLLTEGWLKCLSECRSMLAESASVLSSLELESDVNAFLTTLRGDNFVFELIEIYGIIQRIRLSASINGILDTQLLTLFNQLDQTWGDLARFIKKNDHKMTLKRRLVQSARATTVMDPLAVEPNCGVCVTPVPSTLTGDEKEPSTTVISLAVAMLADEEKEMPAKSMPTPRSVEMLDGFVKRLTLANETLALSVAQLSVLVDLELQDLRRIYAELGMPQVPADISADDWLLAIRGCSFPSHLRRLNEDANHSVQMDNVKREVKSEEEEEVKMENISEFPALETPVSHFPPPSQPSQKPPKAKEVDAFAFFVRHVGATLRREHKSALRGGDVSEAWLESKLASKWASLSSDEKFAWQRAAESASHVT